MKTRCGVILTSGEKILLIHRRKDGREYYVVPGGTRESGESDEQAATRELKEETNLDVEGLKRAFEFVVDDVSGTKKRNVYFTTDKFSGELSFEANAPEAAQQTANNAYIIEWVVIKDIARLNVVPEELKQCLLNLN